MPSGKRTALVVAGLLAGAGALFAGGAHEAAGRVQLTVATVNNPDMAIMQQMSGDFTAATGIGLNFVVLPENELRQKVTEDVGLGSGTYDVVTIGTYDAPIWGRNRWLVSLEPLFQRMSAPEREAYAREDLLPTIRAALSYNEQLYALPFYGESSMMFYRKDLFALAGIHMPLKPTWQEIYSFAVRLRGIEQWLLRDRSSGTAGVGGGTGSLQHGGQRVRRQMVRPGMAAHFHRARHGRGVAVLQEDPRRRG